MCQLKTKKRQLIPNLQSTSNIRVLNQVSTFSIIAQAVKHYPFVVHFSTFSKAKPDNMTTMKFFTALTTLASIAILGSTAALPVEATSLSTRSPTSPTLSSWLVRCPPTHSNLLHISKTRHHHTSLETDSERYPQDNRGVAMQLPNTRSIVSYASSQKMECSASVPKVSTKGRTKT